MPKATLAIYGIPDRYPSAGPAYVHDHNLCLMQDGKVKQYLHLERWTRRKYDNRLGDYLESLVDEGLLELPDAFDLVSVNSFVGQAFISKGGRWRIEPSQAPQVLDRPLLPAKAWWQSGQWQGSAPDAYICAHEWAHIGSHLPFSGPIKDNSLCVHFDGGASVGNFSAFHFREGTFKMLEAHWALSHASKLFNDNALSFKIINAGPGHHCSVPGKLMGYAALGQYRAELHDWLATHAYFAQQWQDMGGVLRSAADRFGAAPTDFDQRQGFWQDVAATFQMVFQNAILEKLQALQSQTQAEHLYYAGGCALNIVANTRIVESGLFKTVHIPPCCNDSGLSLGAAAWLEWQKHGALATHGPYLNNVGLDQAPVRYDRADIARAGDLILAEGVLGICNGNGEAGPRALGQRSLIARPDRPALARHISMGCKKREWYRPIAPIMREDIATQFFGQRPHPLTRYMLLDYQVPAEKQAPIAGVVHTNGTARVQALSPAEGNGFMYDLLGYLWEKARLPALINTSFNAQGEPIVHRPAEAQAAARRMALDGLLINGRFSTF